VIYKIEEINPEHDQSISQIIKSVGAEYCAIGDGFGPSDPEVLCMSQQYGKEDSSIYYIASIADQVVGGSGISAFRLALSHDG
jgi:putative acetyltransferase